MIVYEYEFQNSIANIQPVRVIDKSLNCAFFYPSRFQYGNLILITFVLPCLYCREDSHLLRWV